jgi:hypothetical protein
MNTNYEDVIKLVTVDRVRRKQIEVKIVDKDGDEVPFKDIVKQVMSYLKDKTSEDAQHEGNQILNQIVPLVHQSMVVALPALMGTGNATAILAFDNIRFPMSMMMLLSFSLLKLIQQKEFKIVTIETDLSDEEWDKMQRFHKVTSAAMLGALSGVSPKEIVKEMMKKGYISQEEVDELTGTQKEDEEVN